MDPDCDCNYCRRIKEKIVNRILKILDETLQAYIWEGGEGILLNKYNTAIYDIENKVKKEFNMEGK